MELNQKIEKLTTNLAALDSLAIAFSGGVDSTFLLKFAHSIIAEKLMAVIIDSATFPRRELQDAIEFAESLGVSFQVIEVDNLGIAGFAENARNRCYLCKRGLFSEVWRVARGNNINWVADGSNFDDVNDYRPGMQALAELSIISPLLEAKLGKADIRNLSKEMQLNTWDKPSAACLASRFAYDQRISLKKLNMVELAEDYLMQLGFKQVRVRFHDELARIEVAPDERKKFFDEKILDLINHRFKEIGFSYISLDLAGYRTGSMNG